MDPISDMLTRIRNAHAVKKTEASLPFSKFKFNLAKILKQEGWIKDVSINEEGKMKLLAIQLKYTQDGEPVISGIKRVSKPGQRIYNKTTQIPRIFGGMGTTIISTPKGLMTDRLARQHKVGGEVICQVW